MTLIAAGTPYVLQLVVALVIAFVVALLIHFVVHIIRGIFPIRRELDEVLEQLSLE